MNMLIIIPYAPLKKLFDRFSMELIRVERVNTQGGSIRVILLKRKEDHIKKIALSQN